MKQKTRSRVNRKKAKTVLRLPDLESDIRAFTLRFLVTGHYCQLNSIHESPE
jgi:hypothetical protein